jgi:hypothetical protein
MDGGRWRLLGYNDSAHLLDGSPPVASGTGRLGAQPVGTQTVGA